MINSWRWIRRLKQRRIEYGCGQFVIEELCSNRIVSDYGYGGLFNNGWQKIENAYNDFELCRFRHAIKPIFAKHQVTSVLDYGCGGSDWFNQKFFDGKCATDFF